MALKQLSQTNLLLSSSSMRHLLGPAENIKYSYQTNPSYYDDTLEMTLDDDTLEIT